MTTEKNNDEIDLIELFQKMGNGILNLINKFFNFLYLILLFFIRKSYLIIIFAAVGLIFGYFKFNNSKPYYSSSIEAYSNAMSSIDMINYINNAYKLLVQSNEQVLEKKFNIDIAVSKNIKGIQAYKVIDINKDGTTDIIDYNNSYLTSDTTVSAKRFVVKVEVYNPDVFPVIQESILFYINNNAYITELNNLRKKQLIELISKLEIEITSLDSLKSVEYFEKERKPNTQSGQLLVMNEKETKLFHNDILRLYRQKQAYESTLALNTDAITIIQDFSALGTIENDRLKYMKLNGVYGFIFGIIISLIIENINGIKKIISDSKRRN